MNRHLPFLTALLVAAMTPVPPAHAVVGTLSSTTVTKTLVAGNNTYGGCMAEFGQAVNSASNSPNCPGNWVTFSCVGTYTSKELGFHLLDQAQLALALNKSVLVAVDDTKKHNGYCFAFRIDVIK